MDLGVIPDAPISEPIVHRNANEITDEMQRLRQEIEALKESMGMSGGAIAGGGQLNGPLL